MIKKLYNGTGEICPICLNRIKHPCIGHVTIEQLEEDFNCCLWEEVVDENNYTLGYKPLCKKEWSK